MARLRRRSRSTFSPLVLAGWLFADLSAALVVILLAAATDFPTPPPPEDPEPTVSESPSEEPTPEPLPRGMEQEPLRFKLSTDAADLIAGESGAENALEDELQDKLGDLQEDGRQAGFVIALGVAADPNYGVSLSTAANKVLAGAVPDLMEPAAVKNYWSGMGDGDSAGTVIFEIYLFVAE